MGSVVCAGHVNWDVTLRVDRLPVPDDEAAVRERTGRGGGSAANVAGALVGLAVPATLVGSVGDDDHGDAVVGELRGTGVDCRAVERVTDGETAVKYLVVDPAGEVMVLGCPGANESFTAAGPADGTLAEAAFLHLTNQDPDVAAALADRAHDLGTPVSFDPGRRVWDRPVEPVIERADLLFLNDREAGAGGTDGTGSPSVPGLEPDPDRTVVYKRGAAGAVVATGDSRYRHCGFDVDVVDTAGAGDAFAAGFLATRIDGGDLGRALAVANACGAIASTAVGARTSLSWAAVESLLDGERPRAE